MLTKPDISGDLLVDCVADNFGLRISEAEFRPSGDANSAVYRIVADNRARYFLKLRIGDFDEVAATIPAWLYSKGIVRVMAPIPNAANQPWIRAHGFDWMLYPFVEGKNGFESALSLAQWIALGQTMREVHTAILPPELACRVPRESWSDRNRTIVKAMAGQVEERQFDDPIDSQLAAFWTTNRYDIQTVVERAEQLAPHVGNRTAPFVLCHSDLHAGNVLVGADDELTIVDWDNPVLAPIERDLMFVGGGVGGAWNEPREREWFFAGYGPADVDPFAIAFYRYERIVIDIAEYGERIFAAKESSQDRQSNLRKLMTAFQPNNVIEVAHRAYSELPSRASV